MFPSRWLEAARGRFVALAGVVSLLAVLTASAFVFSSFDIHLGGLASNKPAIATPLPPPGGAQHPLPSVGGKQVPARTITRFVMTSDPQYPWVDRPTPGLDLEAESRRLILKQYDSINDFDALYPVDAVFVNGDLTAYGQGWQIDAMKQFLSVLRPPVYLGLGNHDYENNVGNCMGDACAINSVAWFHAAMLGTVDRFDAYKRAYYEFPLNRTTYSGSLAYAKSFGNIHVIQVNNHPHYELALTGDLGETELDIGSALPWLEDELSWARANGRVIVLNMHMSGPSPDLKKLLDRYEVQAVFAGHFHGTLGLVGDFESTPDYLSGSASSSTYLITEFDDVRREVRVYGVRNSDPFDRQLLDTRPYRDSRKQLPPILPRPAFGIRVNNNGGYNAKYRLRYVGAAGQPVERWSGELMSGQGHQFLLPGSARNVEVYGESRTGLVWAMWKPIFDERLEPMSHCFETWGTTLAPRYAKAPCGHTGEKATTLFSAFNGQCLDVQGGLGGAPSGRALITWPCHDGPNQLVEPVGAELQVGGLCLDVANGHNRQGAGIVLWPCHGGANQRWAVEVDGRIRSLMPGPQRCLRVIAEEGNRLGLWDCDGRSTQQQFLSPREFGGGEDPDAPGDGGGVAVPGSA